MLLMFIDNYKLFVDHIQEEAAGPIPKRRRLREISNSEGETEAIDDCCSDEEFETMDALQYENSNGAVAPVFSEPVPSSCTNSAETSTSRQVTNDTEGNYFFFKIQVSYLKIIFANIYRSISGCDYFGWVH